MPLDAGAPPFRNPGAHDAAPAGGLKYADERLQFTRGLCADDERKRGCVTIIWALICGSSWGCG